MVSLPIVAIDTRGNEIFPGLDSALGLGNDMIDSERYIRPAAVLTSVTVPAKDVFPRQDYLFIWHTHVNSKANNAGIWHRRRDGMQIPAVARCDQLGLAQIKQNNGFLDIADAERLIIMVEHKYFAT